MKKILSVVLFLFLALSVVTAATNSQTIYSVDSAVYQKIAKLYLATGHALPSTTGPWSGDELLKMVDKLDENSIPSYLASEYEDVKAELSGDASISYDGGAMEFDGFLNLDIYAHTYTGDDITRTDVGGVAEKAFAGRRYWFGQDLTKNNHFFEIDWEN